MLTLAEKRNLFNEAVAFYQLAECGRIQIPEKKHAESYSPYIVNMSFCAELFLKLLLIENGKTIADVESYSHNLHTLYNQLPPHIKDMIYSSFKRPMIYKIDDELESIKKAFVDWRYLVLNKAKGDTKHLQVKPYFLKELNEVLCDICRKFCVAE